MSRSLVPNVQIDSIANLIQFIYNLNFWVCHGKQYSNIGFLGARISTVFNRPRAEYNILRLGFTVIII